MNRTLSFEDVDKESTVYPDVKRGVCVEPVGCCENECDERPIYCGDTLAAYTYNPCDPCYQSPYLQGPSGPPGPPGPRFQLSPACYIGEDTLMSREKKTLSLTHVGGDFLLHILGGKIKVLNSGQFLITINGGLFSNEVDAFPAVLSIQFEATGGNTCMGTSQTLFESGDIISSTGLVGLNPCLEYNIAIRSNSTAKVLANVFIYIMEI
jgi:hypothetical protein